MHHKQGLKNCGNNLFVKPNSRGFKFLAYTSNLKHFVEMKWFWQVIVLKPAQCKTNFCVLYFHGRRTNLKTSKSMLLKNNSLHGLPWVNHCWFFTCNVTVQFFCYCMIWAGQHSPHPNRIRLVQWFCTDSGKGNELEWNSKRVFVNTETNMQPHTIPVGSSLLQNQFYYHGTNKELMDLYTAQNLPQPDQKLVRDK